MAEKVDAAAFAARLGVTKQRVSTAIKAGVLTEKSVTVKTAKGGKKKYEIDLEAGLKEWADNIDPSKQRDTAKQAATKEMDGGTSSNYQRARAVKETFAAKLAQLEYQEKAGVLVRADQVKAEAFRVARNVRDSLMGLPERVCAELAHMTEPREIAIYLRAQLAEGLKDLQQVENVGSKRST